MEGQTVNNEIKDEKLKWYQWLFVRILFAVWLVALMGSIYAIIVNWARGEVNNFIFSLVALIVVCLIAIWVGSYESPAGKPVIPNDSDDPKV